MMGRPMKYAKYFRRKMTERKECSMKRKKKNLAQKKIFKGIEENSSHELQSVDHLTMDIDSV